MFFFGLQRNRFLPDTLTLNLGHVRTFHLTMSRLPLILPLPFNPAGPLLPAAFSLRHAVVDASRYLTVRRFPDPEKRTRSLLPSTLSLELQTPLNASMGP